MGFLLLCRICARQVGRLGVMQSLFAKDGATCKICASISWILETLRDFFCFFLKVSEKILQRALACCYASTVLCIHILYFVNIQC